MPKFCQDVPIVEQRQLAPNTFRLVLEAPQIAQTAVPGQFLSLRAAKNSPVLLRRPLGIAEIERARGHVAMIYRVIGQGTKALSQMRGGEQVSVLGALGHGFSTNAVRPLLIGGGMGLSPLLSYAQAMPGRTEILMGGKNVEEMFWPKLFAPYAKKIHITTDDGSVGHKGFTVELLPKLPIADYDLAIVCGPEIMMRKAVQILRENGVPCQVSLERRMACGLGACLSCSLDTTVGRKKVCKDGPVFWAEEVWP